MTDNLLDNGTYRARAITGDLGFTNSGDEQIALTFELADVPGRRLAWYGGFSTEIRGQATKSPCERTFETLRTCGWQGDDLTDLTGIDANEVELVVEAEEYQGQWRNRVKWVNALGGGAALKNVMPPDARKAFAARMKAAAVASRQKLGQSTAGPQAPQQRAPNGQQARPPQPGQPRPQGQRPPQGHGQQARNGGPPPGAGDAWEPPPDDLDEIFGR